MRILVYGDSNSWGYLDDGSGQRFADRWPVSMAQALTAAGQHVELVEECLPGRTTNVDDPQEGAWCNGLTPFEAILLSQQPLDRILIMLGTNDLKHRFGRDAIHDNGRSDVACVDCHEDSRRSRWMACRGDSGDHCHLPARSWQTRR